MTNPYPHPCPGTDCRLCRLYATDRRYRALYDRLAAADPAVKVEVPDQAGGCGCRESRPVART